MQFYTFKKTKLTPLMNFLKLLGLVAEE